MTEVVYQPDMAKADVGFEFKQQRGRTGPVMVLVIRNALKRTVLLDALMTVPGDKDIHQTDVLPVEPGEATLNPGRIQSSSSCSETFVSLMA